MSIKNAQPSAAWLDLLNTAFRAGIPHELIGTTSTGSINLTDMSALAGITIGDRVQGLDIVNSPPTTFQALDETANTAKFSQNATTGHVAMALTVTPQAGVNNLVAGLFTGNPSPLTVDTVLADLVEPTYTGYARQPLLIGPLRRDVDGNFIDPLGSVSFQPSDDTSLPQTATGVFIAGDIGGTPFLLLSEFMDLPFEFTNHFFGLDVDLDMYFKNVTEYGGICTVC
jgi:hypothetical protein